MAECKFFQETYPNTTTSADDRRSTGLERTRKKSGGGLWFDSVARRQS